MKCDDDIREDLHDGVMLFNGTDALQGIDGMRSKAGFCSSNCECHSQLGRKASPSCTFASLVSRLVMRTVRSKVQNLARVFNYLHDSNSNFRPAGSNSESVRKGIVFENLEFLGCNGGLMDNADCMEKRDLHREEPVHWKCGACLPSSCIVGLVHGGSVFLKDWTTDGDQALMSVS